MNSIMLTYPNFRSLPKGLKRLLLVSESMFFDEPGATSSTVRGFYRQGAPEHSPAATAEDIRFSDGVQSCRPSPHLLRKKVPGRGFCLKQYGKLSARAYYSRWDPSTSGRAG